MFILPLIMLRRCDIQVDLTLEQRHVRAREWGERLQHVGKVVVEGMGVLVH